MYGPGTFPIIRLEISGMKHTVQTALTEYAATMDEDLQKAIDAYCEEGRIKEVIRDTAWRTMDAVIKEEVERFFNYGEGRKEIAAQIKERLLERRTYSPLDEA